jgi:hypothetical protein
MRHGLLGRLKFEENMIAKSISTEHGDVSSTAEVLHTDNGQVLLHIKSTLGDAVHEHRVTVGAEDGKDLVSDLSETELQDVLQKHLDEKRNDAATVLSGRAKVSKVVSKLQ